MNPGSGRHRCDDCNVSASLKTLWEYLTFFILAFMTVNVSFNLHLQSMDKIV